jgi:hypothetical protein
MYGEACWDGFKQVGMKTKNGKQVPNCVPEEMSIDDAKKVSGYIADSYEIGTDEYVKHTKKITPGESPKKKVEEDMSDVKVNDIKEWAESQSTIDKYQKRYGDDYEQVLESVVAKMIENIEQLDEKIQGLVNKSEKTGIPYGILKKVFDRGMAAWRGGHRPGATQQQWAFARVNSFITGGGARKADNDLWQQAKGKKEEVERKLKPFNEVI